MEVGLAQTLDGAAATTPLRFVERLVVGGLLQLMAGMVAQLGSGGFSKVIAAMLPMVALPEATRLTTLCTRLGGLAGAGAGLYEQRLVQLACDFFAVGDVAGNGLSGHCCFTPTIILSPQGGWHYHRHPAAAVLRRLVTNSKTPVGPFSCAPKAEPARLAQGVEIAISAVVAPALRAGIGGKRAAADAFGNRGYAFVEPLQRIGIVDVERLGRRGFEFSSLGNKPIDGWHPLRLRELLFCRQRIGGQLEPFALVYGVGIKCIDGVG